MFTLLEQKMSFDDDKIAGAIPNYKIAIH